jgi:hypothetical protein
MFEIDKNVIRSPETLTPAVLQAAEMLGMYHAELARVLKLQCSDIGRLASVQQLIKRGTIEWHQAESFIRFYRAVYKMHSGDETAIYHWLRVDNKQLKGSPLLLIVDDARLEHVINFIENITVNRS